MTGPLNERSEDEFSMPKPLQLAARILSARQNRATSSWTSSPVLEQLRKRFSVTPQTSGCDDWSTLDRGAG